MKVPGIGVCLYASVSRDQPENTRRKLNIGRMLGQSLRRRTNGKRTLRERLVFTGLKETTLIIYEEKNTTCKKCAMQTHGMEYFIKTLYLMV